LLEFHQLDVARAAGRAAAREALQAGLVAALGSPTSIRPEPSAEVRAGPPD
jgi:hypothetical protein